MKEVYLVQHSYLFGGKSDTKVVGIYSSREDAALAVRRLRRRPGFRKYPRGFFVERYELGKDHWVEGFITVK